MKNLFAKNVIEVSAKEAHEAENYGSPAYLALLDAKRQFPDFSIVVKSKSKNAGSFKGLNRDFMKKFIEEHPIEGKDLMAEFNALCGLDDEGNKKTFAAVASFGELRMWFLSNYTELNEGRSQIDKILENIKAAKAAA